MPRARLLDDALGKDATLRDVVGHIAFLQIDKAIGHPAQRQRVERKEVFVQPETNDQWAAGARADHSPLV